MMRIGLDADPQLRYYRKDQDPDPQQIPGLSVKKMTNQSPIQEASVWKCQDPYHWITDLPVYPDLTLSSVAFRIPTKIKLFFYAFCLLLSVH